MLNGLPVWNCKGMFEVYRTSSPRTDAQRFLGNGCLASHALQPGRSCLVSRCFKSWVAAPGRTATSSLSSMAKPRAENHDERKGTRREATSGIKYLAHRNFV